MAASFYALRHSGNQGKLALACLLSGVEMKLAFVLAGLAFASSAAMAASQSHEMHGSMSMKMDHANHQDASAAAVSSTLTVTDCWIRALPEPAPSAGYFVVHNSG